jgi:hypothetical protein
MHLASCPLQPWSVWCCHGCAERLASLHASAFVVKYYVFLVQVYMSGWPLITFKQWFDVMLLVEVVLPACQHWYVKIVC